MKDAELPETIDGIRVKRSGKRAKGGAATGAAPRPRVEKSVVNCLACGKVYDCRPVTNDIIMFLGEVAGRSEDACIYLKTFPAGLPIQPVSSKSLRVLLNMLVGSSLCISELSIAPCM